MERAKAIQINVTNRHEYHPKGRQLVPLEYPELNHPY